MQNKENRNTVVLSTKNLSIGYPLRHRKNICLQEGLNLELHKGNLICIIGQNGCGKTTLIRTLAGVQKAIGGEILLDNENSENLTHVERSNLLSVVLTDKTVVDTMRVSEIVAVGRYSHTNWLGSLKAEDREIISQSLQDVGLKAFANRMYGTLSDGEKQRAFIAKALASQAPILILDEPTAHLDIPNRVEVINLLHELTRKNQQSILVSTHELDLALQVADEIWLLDSKNEISIGTPEEIIDSGIINEVFGGKSFEFLANTGSISLNKKKLGKISLDGRGENADQLARALKRLGIEIGIKEKIHVYADDKNYQLNADGDVTEYGELAEVLHHIRILLAAK